MCVQGRGEEMTPMSYDAQFDNVKGVVAKVFLPKGKQKGCTYSIKVNSSDPELAKWLNDFKCLNISTFDQTPRFEEGVSVTYDRIGVKRNGKYINAYSAGEPQEEINLDNAHEKIPEWVGTSTKATEDEKHIDPESIEDDKLVWDIKMGKLKQAVEIISLLAPEGQQAIAKEITRML